MSHSKNIQNVHVHVPFLKSLDVAAAMWGVFMRLMPFRERKFSQASDVYESLREGKDRVKKGVVKEEVM